MDVGNRAQSRRAVMVNLKQKWKIPGKMFLQNTVSTYNMIVLT